MNVEHVVPDAERRSAATGGSEWSTHRGIGAFAIYALLTQFGRMQVGALPLIVLGSLVILLWLAVPLVKRRTLGARLTWLDCGIGVLVMPAFLLLSAVFTPFVAPAAYPLNRSWLFAAVLIAAWTEELIFRGHLLFGPASGKMLALLMSSILFGVIHLGSGAEGVAYYSATGLILGSVALWRRSIVAPLVAHTVWNVLAWAAS